MKRWGQSIIIAIFLAPLFTPPASALVNERDSTIWGHTFAGVNHVTTVTSRNLQNFAGAKLDAKSTFKVTYNNFPAWAEREMQSAIDIWSANFSSSVPITVDATWGRSAVYGLLGSARPGNYFNNFVNAPDPTLWYPSALANALAGRDLDKNNSEIIIQVNSLAPWDTRNDGTPSASEYDLKSVFIHELGHGLGFLSTDSYDQFFGYGSLEQPTPFDAYLQLDDGRRLSDLTSPSQELGKALTNNLSWSGPNGVAANGGVKPKLYTPSRYQNGSSVSHLDEATFASSGVNSVMTPNLDAGEVFTGPGPLLLAMMEDMRNKPPAGIAVGIPNPVRNLNVLVSDSSAIITFDLPANVRAAQVKNYVIKNLKTGSSTSASSSPFIAKGLKNGTSYTFSVTAVNENGSSDPVTSDAITPIAGWKTNLIDGSSDARYLVSAKLANQPFVAYISSKTGTLRIATYNGSIWKKTVIDGMGGVNGRTNHKLGGHLSICSFGSGSRQVIHLFYGDLIDNDLRHATITPTSYNFEVVDGNATTVQPYDQVDRVKTASDVSVASACAVSSTALQVFYRDESQGVLLGAVKSGSKWSYELIDGDRKTDGRTTGDVGFHLKAYMDGVKTYLIYDSVLVVNQRKEATSGEIRLAIRSNTKSDGWSYQTLDTPDFSAAVLGYDVAINKIAGKLTAAWFAAPSSTLPKPDEIRTRLIDGDVTTYRTDKFGTPNAPLNLNGTTLVVSCQKRLCSIDLITKKVTLVSGWQSEDPIESAWITIGANRFLVAGISGQLVALKP